MREHSALQPAPEELQTYVDRHHSSSEMAWHNQLAGQVPPFPLTWHPTSSCAAYIVRAGAPRQAATTQNPYIAAFDQGADFLRTKRSAHSAAQSSTSRPQRCGACQTANIACRPPRESMPLSAKAADQG
ncbi:hypothetical protein D3C74_307030 [compost metagenome]